MSFSICRVRLTLLRIFRERESALQATILKDVGAALSLDKSDPAKEEAMNNVRKETNAWVAKYRRDNKFAGRPSYG